jgi:hypothetical protein
MGWRGAEASLTSAAIAQKEKPARAGFVASEALVKN